MGSSQSAQPSPKQDVPEYVPSGPRITISSSMFDRVISAQEDVTSKENEANIKQNEANEPKRIRRRSSQSQSSRPESNSSGQSQTTNQTRQRAQQRPKESSNTNMVQNDPFIENLNLRVNAIEIPVQTISIDSSSIETIIDDIKLDLERQVEVEEQLLLSAHQMIEKNQIEAKQPTPKISSFLKAQAPNQVCQQDEKLVFECLNSKSIVECVPLMEVFSACSAKFHHENVQKIQKL